MKKDVLFRYIFGLIRSEVLVIILLLVLSPGFVNAATVSWNGGPGNWSDASKWSTGLVPQIGEHVIINALQSSVTLDQSTHTINSILIGINDSLIINSNTTLSIEGVEDPSNSVHSAIEIHGVLLNHGNISISSFIGGDGISIFFGGKFCHLGSAVISFIDDGSAIRNIGILDITGYLNISDITIGHGILNVNNVMVNYGALISISNTSGMVSPNIFSKGIYNGGANTKFTNHGKIVIDQVMDSYGIDNFGSFDNFDTISISQCENGIAQSNHFQNYPGGIILIDRCDIGMKCGYGEMYNQGEITINQCTTKFIITTGGRLINDHLITLTQGAARGIENQDTIINTGAIYISKLSAIHNHGLTNNHADAYFLNNGLLQVADVETGHGLDLNYGHFHNEYIGIVKVSGIQSGLPLDVSLGVLFDNQGTLDISLSTVTDIDGNEYETVTIDNQQWMAENLRTAHYRNGTPIPEIMDESMWMNTISGAFCWYLNDYSHELDYGKLYNWYAVNDANGLCPTGWHVPDENEWTTLADALGGEVVAGGKMKETGLDHWLTPNAGATNESDFTGRGGGFRSDLTGYFANKKSTGYWWTSTSVNTTKATQQVLNYSNAYLGSSATDKNLGYSIRCVRD